MTFSKSKYYLFVLIQIVAIWVANTACFAQCSAVEVVESIVNGNFNEGYKGFTVPNYTPKNPGDTSKSGTYIVHTNVHPDTFNFPGKSSFNPLSFDGIYDHTTPGVKGNFLMIDAFSETETVTWQQEIKLIPFQKYYFSGYIANLVASNKAQLQIQVKGENDPYFTYLKANVTVGNPGEWVHITDTNYNSGSNTKAIIRIVDTQTDGSPGNDFAIDDFSFMNGCNITSQGNAPDLGGPLGICNSGGTVKLDTKIALDATTNFTWITLPDGLPAGGNTPDVLVTSPGIYKVCVSKNGDCAKSSTVHISQTIKVDLGPDLVLCNPPTATIQTNLTDPTLSFNWYKDGKKIKNQTSAELVADAPGKYAVEVSSQVSNCNPVYDTVEVYTRIATPDSGTFCVGKATFKVKGTGKYAWYNVASGGIKKGQGLSIQVPLSEFPDNATEITYYVQDTTHSPYISGLPLSTSGVKYRIADADNFIKFDTEKDMILKEVSLKLLFPGSNSKAQQGTLEITGPENSNFKQVITVPNPMTPGSAGSKEAVVTVPLKNCKLKAGKGYKMFLNKDAGSTYEPIQSAYLENPKTIYPLKINEVIAIQQPYMEINKKQDYNSFFDMKVDVLPFCGRTPVTLTRKCPSCIKPDSITISPSYKNRTICSSINSLDLSIKDTISLKSQSPPYWNFDWYKSAPLTNKPVGNKLGTTSTLKVNQSPALGSGKYIIRLSHKDATNPVCFLDSVIEIKFESPIFNNFIAQSDTLCDGVKPSLVVGNYPKGGIGMYTYQWQSRTTVTRFKNIPGPNGIKKDYMPENPESGMNWYRRVVTGSICNTSNSDSVFILKPTKITAGEIGKEQRVCPEQKPVLSNLIAPAGGVGAYNYKWVQSETGKDPWSEITGKTADNLIDYTLKKTTHFRRVVYDLECYDTTKPVVAIIAPTLDPGITDTFIAICNNATLMQVKNIKNAAGGTGNKEATPKYQWQKSEDGNVWSNLSLKDSMLNLVPNDIADTIFFRRRAVTGTTSCDTAFTKKTTYIKQNQTIKPEIETYGISVICKGDSLALSVAGGSSNSTYAWLYNQSILPGQHFASLNALKTGTFQVILKNKFYNKTCSDTSLPFILKSENIDLPKSKEKEILAGTSVVLDGMTVPLGYSKNWISKDTKIKYNADSLNPTVQPEISTLYMLVTTSPTAQCKDTGTITVNVLMLVDAPNVFTPNGDGLNDTWELKGFEDYNNGTVKVFNRYGVAVYETKDYKAGQGWNGTSNGAELPVGTYYYVVEPNTAGLKAMTGFVVLLR